MLYTVSSRGRPIGVTDLGFIRVVARQRSGWFHPNAEGERLMPLVATPVPAMRAYLSRDLRGDDGRAVVRPELIRSTMFADLSELLQHTQSRELALHHEDGTLVPTEDIGFQDTEALIEIGRSYELREDDPEALEERIAADVAEDVAIIEELLASREPWRADEEPSAMPRYQIHVRLARGVQLP